MLNAELTYNCIETPHIKYTWCGYEVPRMISLRDLRWGQDNLCVENWKGRSHGLF